jgi:DNA topoisomerase VI subunit B
MRTTAKGIETQLSRTAFVTDRTLEFFSESELTTQIGYGKKLWPLVLSAELIGNSLDACEATNVPPEITIHLEKDSIAVGDNGPGLPDRIIETSLDYHVRVSDKKGYIAPTRGQLGNALKCVWAAAFVANGQNGRIEVEADGLKHHIEVSLDRIAQEPLISHLTEPSVKKGTLIKVYWSGIAGYEAWDQNAEFYQARSVSEALPHLVADFASFNPHATFTLTLPDGKVHMFPASDRQWRKWRTSDPTSAHWYRPQDLRALIAAYVKDGKHKTLRDFVGEFDGLSGTQYRKHVLEAAHMSLASLNDLVLDGDIDMAAVERLLTAMKGTARPVSPDRLGVMGKDHFVAALATRGAAAETSKYQKIVGKGDDGLPYVVEVGFGVKNDGRRERVIGLNHSPVFKVPSGHLSEVLSACRVQPFDQVVLLVHEACPRFSFTDHGKGSVA